MGFLGFAARAPRNTVSGALAAARPDHDARTVRQLGRKLSESHHAGFGMGCWHGPRTTDYDSDKFCKDSNEHSEKTGKFGPIPINRLAGVSEQMAFYSAHRERTACQINLSLSGSRRLMPK